MDTYQIKALTLLTILMGVSLYRLAFHVRDRKVACILIVILTLLYLGVLFL